MKLDSRLLREGPHRVMVDRFEARPTRRAREMGIIPEVVFLRNDGWMLGAPNGLEAAAYRMWADCWVGFARQGETQWRAMREYRP